MLRFKSKIHNFSKAKIYIFLLAYMVCSKIIGNQYPFARYDMYSTIPNYAYSFYITDENDIFLDSLFFNVRNLLAHQYSSTCQSYQFSYGYENETQEELSIIGEKMLDASLSTIDISKLNVKTLCLYRVNFLIEKQKIRKHELLMFEKTLD